jgi:hypothetical protein
MGSLCPFKFESCIFTVVDDYVCSTVQWKLGPE